MRAKSLKPSETDKISDKFSNRDVEPPVLPLLPFQEWSDQEIRLENWKGPENTAQKTAPTTPRSHLTFDDAPSEPTLKDGYHFEDTQNVTMPYSIVVFEWKTASEVFPNTKLEIYDDTNDYPDLIGGNKHLLCSEFMRMFISSIHMLIYLGNTSRFAIEYVSPNFTPTTKGQPWKPWHHIYSNSFAGTKHSHDPTFNKTGKYIVRLFWLGTWRKIYVDDKLPVDILGHVLLPSILKPEPLKKEPEVSKSTSSRVRINESKFAIVKSEEKIIELWPYLLAKALLKVASLTCYENKEIIDFDIVQCLTGWHPTKIQTKGLPISDIWEICWGYTNHYKWGPEERSKSNKSVKSEKSDKSIQLSKKEKPEKIGHTNDVRNEEIKFCHVVARCDDLRNLTNTDDPHNIFPCWGHYLLIDQTRDIPLLRPTLSAGVEDWKRLRWLPWAVENGIIPGEELLPEIRSYRLVTNFKQISEYTIYLQPSKISVCDVPSVPEPPKKDFQKKAKGKEGQKGEKSSKGSHKSDSSKGSKDKKKKNTTTSDVLIADPSFWVDHDQLSSHINTLIVYYKPSEFKTKIEISDTNQRQQSEKKSGELEWQIIMNPNALKKSRNEPFYIFSESIDTKLIVISLSQMGFSEILGPEKKIEKPIIPLEELTECEFCMASVVKRVKRNIKQEIEKNRIPIPKMEPSSITHTRSTSHIVLEDYNWTTDSLGDTVTFINTYGTKTTTLNLGPGRKIMKLWVRSDTPYSLQIFSITPIALGNLEQLLTSMSQESQLLDNMCIQISNNFVGVVEAFGKPQFTEKLKAFYSSYKPEQDLTKAQSLLLHNIFYDLLCELVDDCLEKNELYALKVLFFKWQFPLHTHYPEGCSLCNCYHDDDLEYLKATEIYVTKIQAFFRGIYERSYLRRHRPSHREHKTINESLTNIYATIFSVENRLKTCPNLIRAFLLHPDMNAMKEKYTVAREIQNVLDLKQIQSTVKIVEDQWTLICRQQFSVNSTDPILIKINLFCDLDDYVLRVIDNDTTKEIKRYTNNTAVGLYKSNSKGYTVLCYVSSGSLQILNYKLNFSTVKEVEFDKLTLSAVNIETNSMNGLYSPNTENCICKYFINVRSPCVLFSLHFVCSFSDVLVQLKLYNHKQKLVKEITGRGEVVMPAIYLTNDKKGYDLSVDKNSSIVGKMKIKSNVKSLMKINDKTRLSGSDKKFRMVESQTHALQPQEPRLRLDVSAKPHVRPFYHAPETKEVKKNLRVEEPAEYVLELSVLYDSWPLTSDEWQNVANWKYLEANRLRRADSQTSLYSKMSMVSGKKQRKQRSTIRLPSASKPQKPYWIIETVQNQNENIEMIKDSTKQNDMMAMKMTWYEHDIGRANRAQELRKTFLEENEILNLVPEDTDSRSLTKETFSPKILPPLDLRSFMNKDPEEVNDKRKLKNNDDLELDAQKERELIEEATTKHAQSIEKINQFTEQQVEGDKIIQKWWQEIRQDSLYLMTEALKERATCYSEYEEAKKQEQEKIAMMGKKVKKGKKDKKG